MTTRYHFPAWNEALLALVLACVALPGLMPLREPGGPWDPGYAALVLVNDVLMLAILAYAAHRCRRLWWVPPSRWSRADHVGTGLVAAAGVLAASGPLSSGRWSWVSAALLVLAAYLVVAQVRAVRVGRRAPDERSSVAGASGPS